MFKKGLGTDIDMDKAIDYFKRSAEMNNTNAKRTLALEYIYGKHLNWTSKRDLKCSQNVRTAEIRFPVTSLGKYILKER